jgi:hypothetical protein
MVRFSTGLVMMAINEFGLECGPEALHWRIIVTANDSTEAKQHAVFGEQHLVLMASVLATLVGVVE